MGAGLSTGSQPAYLRLVGATLGVGSTRFQFPSEEAALTFVRYLTKTIEDVACLRSGSQVWVIDGTHLHSKDVLYAACKLFEGYAV
jgi:hypothetical protein